jgi:hypothetical protein
MPMRLRAYIYSLSARAEGIHLFFGYEAELDLFVGHEAELDSFIGKKLRTYIYSLAKRLRAHIH